jgi:CubicO group peptidase (beta-lactamase class C family)
MNWSGLVILAVWCAISASAADSGEKAARIRDLVAHYQRCGYLNGAVLVADHGKVLYAQGVGEANMETHTPNTPHTRFGIASISKQFTAALVLQEVAEGRLRLDGTVADYLPWYRKDAGARMTIEQLIHHTSGLPADFDQPEFGDGREASRHYSPKEFAEKFCQPSLVAEPGKKWAYSNCGYILLGLILEHVSGKPFEDLLKQQILEPLGMKDTGMDNNDLVQKGGASGYLRHAGPRYTPGPEEDRVHCFAAGAMYSTLEDLFRWDRALASDKLFTKEQRDQIFTPGLNNWGYGWFVTHIAAGWPGAGSPMAEMRGDMPGNFFSWILRYPEQEAVVIVLRNGYGSPEHLEDNLQAILFGQTPRLPHRNPKDILAQAWQVAWGKIASPRSLGLAAILAALIGIWQMANRRRGARAAVA